MTLFLIPCERCLRLILLIKQWNITLLSCLTSYAAAFENNRLLTVLAISLCSPNHNSKGKLYCIVSVMFPLSCRFEKHFPCFKTIQILHDQDSTFFFNKWMNETLVWFLDVCFVWISNFTVYLKHFTRIYAANKRTSKRGKACLKKFRFIGHWTLFPATFARYTINTWPSAFRSLCLHRLQSILNALEINLFTTNEKMKHFIVFPVWVWMFITSFFMTRGSFRAFECYTQYQ